MAERRRGMRRILLIVTLAVVSTVFALMLWQSPAREYSERWTSVGIIKVKSAIESAKAKLRRSTPDSLAKSRTERPAGEAHEHAEASEDTKHAHGNGTTESDAARGTEEPEAEEHGEGEVVALNAAQVKEFGIELAVASDGPIATHIERPAEIKFDGDRMVHVVSRVEGIVSSVAVSQGEYVAKDAVMAVLDSRELAELKAGYLAAFERRTLARETFDRERRLWEKKISSEKDYLDAKTGLAEAEISLRAAGQKLLALGFSRQYLEDLNGSKDADLTRYEIRAPIPGTVIERHISLGEAVSAEKESFLVADTSTVWVDVTLYPRDMSLVRTGQTVSIDTGEGKSIQGEIKFVTPHVREETRTATARVINGNVGGRLKPGMFVKASIAVGQESAGVRIPKGAIQNYENGPVVFVQDGEKFEPRPVRLGRENAQYVEIVSGVSPGEIYAAKGSFTLKAELEKASFGDGHNH